MNSEIRRKLKMGAILMIASVFVVAFQNCSFATPHMEGRAPSGGDGHEGKPTLLIDSETSYDPQAQMPSVTYYEVSTSVSCSVDQQVYPDFIGSLLVSSSDARLYCSSESDVNSGQAPSGPYQTLSRTALGYVPYQPGLVTQDARLYASDRTSVQDGVLYCRSNSTSSASMTGVDLLIKNHTGTADVPVARYLFESSATLPSGSVFSRSSSATFINASGLLETAAINQPRWFRNSTTGVIEGLLIESVATNIIPQSNNFSSSPWNPNNATIVTVAGSNPVGLNGYSSLVETGTNAWHQIVQIVPLETNTNYVFSAFVKDLGRSRDISVRSTNLDGAHSRCTFSFQSESFSSTTVDQSLKACHFEKLANGWYRISVVYDSGEGRSAAAPLVKLELWDPVRGGSYIGDGTSGVAIWGAQLEKSSAPTSYIATTTSSASRSADRLDLSVPALSGGDLSLFVRSKPQALIPNVESGLLHIVGANSGATRFSVSSTSYGRISLQDASGSSVLAGTPAGSSVSRLHQALAVGANFVRAYQNGEPSGAASVGVATDLTTFQITSDAAHASQAIVSEFAIYEPAFSHADLASLSGLGGAPTLQLGTVILGAANANGEYKRIATIPIALNETSTQSFTTDSFDFKLDRLNDTGSYLLSTSVQGGTKIQETLQCYSLR